MIERDDHEVELFLAEAIFELRLGPHDKDALPGRPVVWYLHSDRAKEFVGKRVRHFLAKTGGIPIFGVSYRSTSNAIAESLV